MRWVQSDTPDSFYQVVTKRRNGPCSYLQGRAACFFFGQGEMQNH